MMLKTLIVMVMRYHNHDNDDNPPLLKNDRVISPSNPSFHSSFIIHHSPTPFPIHSHHHPCHPVLSAVPSAPVRRRSMPNLKELNRIGRTLRAKVSVGDRPPCDPVLDTLLSNAPQTHFKRIATARETHLKRAKGPFWAKVSIGDRLPSDPVCFRVIPS